MWNLSRLGSLGGVLIGLNATPGLAGVNAGGVLFLHIEESLTYTLSSESPCEAPLLDACRHAVTTGYGNEVRVVSIYAAFPRDALPQVSRVAFGIEYSSRVIITDAGFCGDSVLFTPDWPQSISGAMVSWQRPQTSTLQRIGWLAASNLDDSDTATLMLATHPEVDWSFGDLGADDRAAGFGSVGFRREGGVVCPDNEELLGACCLPRAPCIRTTQVDCESRERLAIFAGPGVPCDPGCFRRGGPCCFPGGLCVYQFPDDCAELGGYYLGDDESCYGRNLCRAGTLGACCLANGVCIPRTAPSCETVAGVYLGDLVECDPTPCPPTGACCFARGYCTPLYPEPCAERGGSFLGEGTVCDPNPCPQPPRPCCLPDSTCALLSREECAARIGQFSELGESCPLAPCAPPGWVACCVPDCGCAILTLEECAERGWYDPYFFSCASVICCDPAVRPTTWGRLKSIYKP